MGLREDLEQAVKDVSKGGGDAVALRALREILARYPKPSGETVRVRVAVIALNEETWAAHGHPAMCDVNSINYCREMNESDGGRVTFITADVPLPEAPAEVEAECEATP
jgi:hypothetical protein